MKELHQLVHKDIPALETLLFEGINDEAVRTKGMDPIFSFGICIEDEKQNLLGGVKGVTYYGCLYVDMLWIEKNLRHLGWGTKLMREAEKIGKEKECTFATVNTMDWEALSFYQKLGYAIEFTRDGYKKGSKLYMLRKQL